MRTAYRCTDMFLKKLVIDPLVSWKAVASNLQILKGINPKFYYVPYYLYHPAISVVFLQISSNPLFGNQLQFDLPIRTAELGVVGCLANLNQFIG